MLNTVKQQPTIPEPEKPDYGKAVVDKQLRYVSASAISAFNPRDFGGCNRRWYFEKIEGRKTPDTKATVIGGHEHKHLAHYLKTGEDVLTHITRPGKHFLPHPGSDLIIEQAFGDYKKALETRERVMAGKATPDEVAKYIIAPHGIPVMGAMDVRHRRGEWVDNDGDVWQEAAPSTTAEVLDHKTTSSIREYAKQSHVLPKLTQMALYAKAATHVWPDLEYVRVSHSYFGTRAREAQKYTALMSRHAIDTRYEEISSVVLAMTHVAREPTVDKVEPNLESCSAYRGCPHSSYCDRPKGTAADLLQLPKGAPMSTGLFGNLTSTNGTTTTNGVAAHEPAAPSAPAGLFAPAQPVAPTPPPAPAQSEVDRQAAIAAARALLAAEDAATAAATTSAPPIPPRIIAMPHIGTVNPTDALPATATQIAAPLSAEVIAQITDPEIAARVTAHAAAVATAAPVAGTKEKTSGRCSMIDQKIAITADEILEQRKKWPCPKCGKEMRLKPEKNAAGGFEVTITSHNMQKTDAAPPVPVATTAAPPIPPVAAVPPPLPPSIVLAPPVVAVPAVSAERTGTNIFFVNEDGTRREITKEALAAALDAPTPPPVPVAAPVVQAAPPALPTTLLFPQMGVNDVFTPQHAAALWNDGHYEAASSLSLIIIAKHLSK